MTVEGGKTVGRWATISQAFRAYQFPSENLPLVQRIMDRVRVDYYEGTQSYIKAIRRDGARTLTVHYGYTSGFETEADAVKAAGDVDRELFDSRWRINHPLNDVGAHHRGSGSAPDKQPASICPTCFMELPVSGVCDSCG